VKLAAIPRGSSHGTAPHQVQAAATQDRAPGPLPQERVVHGPTRDAAGGRLRDWAVPDVTGHRQVRRTPGSGHGCQAHARPP
jgi:hypothetical protein